MIFVTQLIRYCAVAMAVLLILHLPFLAILLDQPSLLTKEGLMHLRDNISAAYTFYAKSQMEIAFVGVVILRVAIAFDGTWPQKLLRFSIFSIVYVPLGATIFIIRCLGGLM